MRRGLTLLIGGISIGLIGCGGSSGSSSGASPFVGTYDAPFTRGANDTHLMMTVAANGSVTLLIDDIAGSGNPWTGTGTVSADGTFSGSASQSRAPINVSGRFAGTGSSATFTGSVSGGMTATGITGTPVADYSNVMGTYQFTATGGPNASVGTTTGTITFVNGGKFTLTGTNAFGDQWSMAGSITALGIATSTGTYTFGQSQGMMNCTSPGSFVFNAARSGGTATLQVVPTPTGVTTTFSLTLTRSGT